MHTFFDGYINSTTSLNQFVKQYDNTLRSRKEKEFDDGFNSTDIIIPCESNSSIEKNSKVSLLMPNSRKFSWNSDLK